MINWWLKWLKINDAFPDNGLLILQKLVNYLFIVFIRLLTLFSVFKFIFLFFHSSLQRSKSMYREPIVYHGFKTDFHSKLNNICSVVLLYDFDSTNVLFLFARFVNLMIAAISKSHCNNADENVSYLH